MTPEQRQTLIHELREFARAYPEDIFTPFTEEELKRHSVIITRASAAAGRHFALWFLKAAAALDQMDADEGLMKQARKIIEESLPRVPFGDGCHLQLIVVSNALRARLGDVASPPAPPDQGGEPA